MLVGQDSGVQKQPPVEREYTRSPVLCTVVKTTAEEYWCKEILKGITRVMPNLTLFYSAMPLFFFPQQSNSHKFECKGIRFTFNIKLVARVCLGLGLCFKCLMIWIKDNRGHLTCCFSVGEITNTCAASPVSLDSSGFCFTDASSSCGKEFILVLPSVLSDNYKKQY